jgi:hypothetical protein
MTGRRLVLQDGNLVLYGPSGTFIWQSGTGVHIGAWLALQPDPHIRRAGMTISVDEAVRTRGALLFAPGHVAISLGNGQTIEARGRRYGVNIFSTRNRGWTIGGRIPGMRY